MGAGRTILMRGHGATMLAPTVRHAVFISVYLEVNAKLQMQAMAMGDIKFLTSGEVDKIIARTGPYTHQPRLGELVPAGRPPGHWRRAEARPRATLRAQRHFRPSAARVSSGLDML